MTEDERRRTYADLDARPVPCRELEATGRLTEFDRRALAWLRRHGVEIEDRGESIRLHMPAGTTMQILYPFDVSERYRVRLPDGAEVTYTYVRGTFAPHRIGVPQDAISRVTETQETARFAKDEE